MVLVPHCEVFSSRLEHNKKSHRKNSLALASEVGRLRFVAVFSVALKAICFV
jgi:hypothetical protein